MLPTLWPVLISVSDMLLVLRHLIRQVAIAYRILSTRSIRNLQASRIRTALIIFVESAVIYSASVLALVVVYELSNNAHYILLDLTTSIIGVTFTLVTLRLALASPSSGHSDAGNVNSDPAQSRANSRRHNSSYTYPLTTVSISRFVEVSRERGQYEQDVSSEADSLPETPIGKEDIGKEALDV
ncbi:hypothetical protein MIND_00977200 [Mycena indigotica]|uniref:Uncharacterized protein n=1 Tax=Mycena indigotica TaxID=2126181 RepID=A0A8H6VZE7_9AGAR|nr:uncharacterized protein MIND_00977200 [Mycena indigotica]KAF7297436.1 hypothetical protein MIND_00977200 [Mycena indigotica]